MNRNESEALRNLHGKLIRKDVVFVRRNQVHPLLTAELEIENSSGLDLRLNIHFNPEVGSKTFNVSVRGVGAICRLDVDGHAHGEAGRQHKHSLQSERCPDRNLPDNVQPRPGLKGRSVRECFEEFCRISHIQHVGSTSAARRKHLPARRGSSNMIALDEVQRQLQERSLVREIDVVPKGHIRIMTGLLYPDGASVEVFIVNDTPVSPASATPAKPLRLSDLGQTIAWLLDVGVRPWQSRKRQAFIEDVLRLYDVQQDGGALCIDLKPGDDLMVGILRLAQSCIRVADLTFTRRASLQSPFSDDVEEVLADAELRFEVGAELVGRAHTTPPTRSFAGGSISRSPGGITRT